MDPIPVTDPDVLARFHAQAASPPQPQVGQPQPVTDPAVLERFKQSGYTPVSSGGGVTISVRNDGVQQGEATQPQQPQEPRSPVATAASTFAGTFDRELPKLLAPLDAIPHDVAMHLGYGNDVLPFEHAVQPIMDWFANGGSSQPTALSPENQPDSTEDRLAQAAGKFTAENLPAVVGVNTLANSGVRAVEGAAPTLWNAGKRATNAVLDYIAGHPVSTNAGELIAGAEAGAGGEAGRENAAALGYGPEGQELAESLGQIVTPSAMDYAPGAILARAARPLYKGARFVAENAGKELGGAVPEQYRPDWLTNLANQGNVRRTVQAQNSEAPKLNAILSQPETQSNLTQTQQLQEQIPGFNPGTARASGDQGLINTQRAFDTEATGQDLRSRQQAYDTSAQAIRQHLETGMPQLNGETPAAEVVGGAVRGRVDAARNAVQQQLDTTQGQIRDISNSLPTADRAQVGNTLRDIRDTEQDQAEQTVNRLRSQIGDPQTPIVVGHDEHGTEITMPLGDVLNRQAAINQQLRLYRSANMRTVADVQQMQRLIAEKQSLDQAIENTDASMVPGLQAYRDYYRDEYVPRFSEGASRNVGRYGQFGYDKNLIPDERVPAQWFAPNNISGARQFNKLYGTNPEARQAITDYALDDLRQKVVDPNTGLIREGAINTWLNRNSRVLDELPFIRDAVPQNTDALYARMGQLAQQRQAIEDTKIAKLLGNNPDALIDAGLKDPQTMRELGQAVQGNPNAETALRRAVWDRVARAAGGDTLVDPDKLEAFINANRRSLQQVLSPEHLQNIETVIQAARIQGRVPRPVGTVQTPLSGPEALGKATGVTIPQGVASLLSIARGRSSPFYELPMQAIRAMTAQKRAAVKNFWNAALSDPQAAQVIADSFRAKKPTTIQMRRMGAYLLTAGIVQPGANAEFQQ